MDEAQDKKCKKCKSYRYPRDFRKNGREMKTCIKCRELSRKSRIKNKCPHGKQKNKCRNCGGSQICEHKKQKAECKDCGGSQICEHQKQKSRCKDCKLVTSNPLKESNY